MGLPVVGRTPTLAELITAAVDARLIDVHTALPARVERYDADKQLVDVQPLLKAPALEEAGGTVVEPLPIIANVPVRFDGGGGFRTTYPIAVGDTCLVLFSEASLDVWLDQGGLVDPRDLRRFHLSDAVAFVGLNPFSAPWSGADESKMTLGHDDGMQIVVSDSEVQLGTDAATGATEQVVLGTKFRSDSATMNAEVAKQLGIVSAQLVALSAAITALGGVLASQGPLLLIPPAGIQIGAAGGLFAGAGTAAAAQAGAAAAQAAAAITKFETAAATHLSDVVKTK